MRQVVLIIVFVITGSFILKAQNQDIPLEDIKEIADRNAKSLWGNVYPDEPIPYYSAQDRIIAYRFNYCNDNIDSGFD